MNVSVFGLGYVGCVSIACLSKLGHRVWGVDVNSDKVQMMNAGKSPIIEPGVTELLAAGVKQGRIKCTDNPRQAVPETDVSLICVGTPSASNGSLNMTAIESVSEQLGEAIAPKAAHHTAVFRSTVLPGTTNDIIIPAMTRKSDKKVHEDFDVCYNPEFLREGTAVQDYYDPPFTVHGQYRKEAGDKVAELYSDIRAEERRTSYKAAEMLKYACNSFHALKVAFGNGIGTLCKSLGIDSHEVITTFCLDTKLNISSAYLKPAYAFGGSCLPKDLRALQYKAKQLDVHVPVINAVMKSNRMHIERSIDWIIDKGKKKIGVLGFSFKAETDDLRESPTVTLIERLIGKGYDLKIYDSDVSLARIFGANKKYLETGIPHISSLLVSDVNEVIEHADIIIIAKPESRFRDVVQGLPDDKLVYDLVRIAQEGLQRDGYEGICW